ncbi:MAG: hypothetical protein IT348_16720 [Candidatus Eisenbacteria bacterium]|nr:hypothetical protein [Candidatus Eisenbacteria bacterium]
MPKRDSILFLLLALLFMATPGPSAAAPLGHGFTYQGQLQQAGVPVDGTVSLRFSLWDAAGTGTPPTGGTQIGGTQTLANTIVAGGVFSVALNAGDEFGAQAFNGEARWLQVEVCADSTCATTTVLGPRQPVTAAPYALGPWQLTGTSISFMQGNVGIGTAAPAHPLHIKATSPALILEDKAIASQQSGYLGFWNPTSETGWIGYGTPGSPVMTMANARASGDIVLWSGGERLRVRSTGNVGIGTSTPASKLDVRGDIRLGSAGDLLATGGEYNFRIVRGVVAGSGTRVFGSGFTSTRTGTGVYAITFDTAFLDQPSITATCQGTLDRIAVISSHLAGSCTIRVISGSGTPVDCYFDLIVIGRR